MSKTSTNTLVILDRFGKMYQPVTANIEVLPISLYKGTRIISFTSDITVTCNIYDLHVLIDINYVKCHFNVFYMCLVISYKKYSGIHRNVSGIVLLEYLLYYIFALNL